MSMVVPSRGSHVLYSKCFSLAWRVREKLNIYLLIDVQNLSKRDGLKAHNIVSYLVSNFI